MKVLTATLAAIAIAAVSPAQDTKFKSKQGDTTQTRQDTSREAPREGMGKIADAQAKTVAEKATHYERVHRERMARIRRLLSIYREKGDDAKVRELEAMRDGLEKRHANAMKGFRDQLGEQRWAQVDKHIRGPSARALEVRNERANENAAARDARKAEKDMERRERKADEPPKGDKPDREKPDREKPDREKDKEQPREKPPGQRGGSR